MITLKPKSPSRQAPRRPQQDMSDGVPMPQRAWAVLTVALAVTLSVMDGAIANVALPTIVSDLGATPASSIWVVNAYQLAVTVALLPVASLGEIYGYQKVYRIGLLLFTISSLFCAMAWSLPTLVLARVLQGFGASGVLAINTAMIRTIYPRAWLGRGIGINATIVAFASAAGPTIAGAILSVASWPWLFAVNIPIGTLAFVISIWALPRVAPAPRAFDVISAIMNAMFFGLLVIGVDGLANPADRWRQVTELVAAVAIGVALVLRQLSRPAPLLPIDLLRIPIFALSALTSTCAFIAWTLAAVALPFYFQDTLGHTTVATGLLMTPWPLAIMVVAPIAGRLADRYSVGVLAGTGLAVFAAGLLSLALLPAHPADWDIVWRMALSGAGFAMFQSPNNRAMISAAPKSRSGGAAGLLATARLLGQTMGAAMVAMLFTVYPTTGSKMALWVACAVAGFAVAVSSTRLGRRG